MTQEKIKIVIADDHVLIADAWASLINLDPRFTVIKIYDNTQDLIDEVNSLKPDIVILDINIPPVSGLDAVKIIRRMSPATKVIGVSMHNQPSFARRMLRNGASAYVTKSSKKEEMYIAIEHTLAGKTYICSEIQKNITEKAMLFDQDPISKLTEREIEIIKFVKDGFSNKEIAEKIFLSIRTIETHRARILKKLNIKNTAALIKLANDSIIDF